MKDHHSALSFFLSVFVAISPSFAGEAPIEVVPEAVSQSSRAIQPLFSRYAQTSKDWVIRINQRTFSDIPLQEVDRFEGHSTDLELTIPLDERWQLRIYYPFDTKGDAKDSNTQDDVEVDGKGGIFQFPSMIADYQYRVADAKGGCNLSAYFGLGNVRQSLHAKNQVTGKEDLINHRGSAIIFGVKADRRYDNGWEFVGNLGGRYYWDSDDIHPNDGPDIFMMFDAALAFIYAPEGAWFYPGLELVYQGSINYYNSLMAVPQVVIPLGKHVDLTAGVGLGVLHDGPSMDARLQLRVLF